MSCTIAGAERLPAVLVGASTGRAPACRTAWTTARRRPHVVGAVVAVAARALLVDDAHERRQLASRPAACRAARRRPACPTTPSAGCLRRVRLGLDVGDRARRAHRGVHLERREVARLMGSPHRRGPRRRPRRRSPDGLSVRPVVVGRVTQRAVEVGLRYEWRPVRPDTSTRWRGWPRMAANSVVATTPRKLPRCTTSTPGDGPRASSTGSIERSSRCGRSGG